LQGIEDRNVPSCARYLRIANNADESKDERWLEQIRTEMLMTPSVFRLQILMDDTTVDGALFKPDQIPIVSLSQTPYMEWIGRGWDMGATDSGDPTASVKLGRDANKRYYILHVSEDQLEIAARNKFIRDISEADGTNCTIVGPQDPGAAGKEAALLFCSMLAGYDVHTYPVTKNKMVLAQGLAAQCNAGNVAMVKGLWNAKVLDQMASFDGMDGRRDDIIDAGSAIFNHAWKQTGDKPDADKRRYDTQTNEYLYAQKLREIKRSQRRR
jgi:predicted phage terminase large subunit-like protein